MMKAFDNNLSLSLCSGAGGLDLGLERAGWHTAVQIEMDADCVKTLASRATQKHPPEIIQAPIEAVQPIAIRKKLGLRRGQLGLIAGGPPCQPFTTHGLRQGIRDVRATGVFPHYISFVKEFMPQAVLMENVDGLLSAALMHRRLVDRTKIAPLQREEMKGSFLQWLVGELVGLGYAVSWGLVEAADYSVPQYRQRALLIGVQSDQPCYLPPERPNALRLTVRDALCDVADPGPIQPLSKRKRDIYQLIPPGGNWRDLSRTLQIETMGAAFRATGGKGGWWRRLSWDEPAPTILGMPDHSSTGLIHPDEVRCLGLNECAAIQTFPSGMNFSGKPRSQYQQVGNAVPPKLAQAIGRHLIEYMQGKPVKPPKRPEWRQTSANRRIGTHGWSIPNVGGSVTTLNVKVREDHVWTSEVPNLPGFEYERTRLAA